MNKNALKLPKNLQINAIYGTTQFASKAKINIFGFFFEWSGRRANEPSCGEKK